MSWKSIVALSFACFSVVACSSNSGTTSNSGGTTAKGGAAASDRGGAFNSGGVRNPSGGTQGGSPASGGATQAAGGASGDTTNRGGASQNGGNASGGAMNGGRSASGGTSSGGTSNGGTSSDGSGGGASGGGAGGSSDAVNAATMVSAMGFGTNIGNTLENTTSWETGWGQPLITQAFINGIASRGIKTVRVPVAWNTYASNGSIDPSKMSRVKEVVAWIEAAGMYSIVNIHWDGGWIFNESNANKYKLTEDVRAKFGSYWAQIASAFSSVGHKLIFEALNEEGRFYIDGDTNKPDYAALNQVNQLFVTTVRAQSGYNKTRALLIAGFNTDIELTCVDSFAVPNDPAGSGRIFLSLHYYTPYTFCGLDSVESWGSPATTWGTDTEKAALQALFTKAANFAAQKKVPIILGEFGVTRGEKYPRDPASRVLWMESVAKASISRGIVPVLWDTGSEIQRSDGAFSPELQAVMDHIK